MTTQAVRDRQKTVTRRLGWSDLKPGTLLWAVEKGMGLKKGEHVKKLALIRVVGNERQHLDLVMDRYHQPWGQEEMEREGFPYLSPEEFVDMFARANKIPYWAIINRIAFEYIDQEEDA